jgi:hypothetical protein
MLRDVHRRADTGREEDKRRTEREDEAMSRHRGEGEVSSWRKKIWGDNGERQAEKWGYGWLPNSHRLELKVDE